MSLLGTLGKVAVGIAVAKGVGKMMSNRSGGGSGGGLGGLLGGAGGAAGGLGGLLGGGQQNDDSGGGIGGGIGSNQSNQGGGLGDLLGGAGGLGGLLGGAAGGAGGGLGGLLENLGGAGGSGGGLGDLLNSALQGKPMAQQPSQNQEETAKILIQAMVNAAKSDGEIDQQEQQKIVSNLGEEVSAEEREFVLAEMRAPLDMDSFVRSVPRGAEQQVYLMSLMGIDLDTQGEAQYLDKLRQALGITEQASNQIHEQLGAPTLYS